MVAVLLLGDLWTVVFSFAFMVAVDIVLPITAVVLVIRYFRRKRENR